MGFFNIFKKKKPIELPDAVPKRPVRELLRENLATIPVDMYAADDPLISMSDEDRKVYLKYFYEIVLDRRLIGRIKYLINLQAKKTFWNQGDGNSDIAGAMTVNGMSFIKDDIERLSNTFLKENGAVKKEFDKMGI